MGDYPYILNTGKLKSFLDSISKIGVPDKINTQTLPKLGYKSTHDRPIVKILRFIDFVDANGVPNQNYINFRDTSKAKVVMANAIKKAYSELFKMYPDAHKKDDETLKNFFRPTTKAGEQVIDRMVDTFKVLCSFADFEAITTTESKAEEYAKMEKLEVKGVRELPSGITLNLNIQLVLPTTDDASVYDKIFKALKDHLLSRD
jgi:hypothetical protein